MQVGSLVRCIYNFDIEKEENNHLCYPDFNEVLEINHIENKHLFFLEHPNPNGFHMKWFRELQPPVKGGILEYITI